MLRTSKSIKSPSAHFFRLYLYLDEFYHFFNCLYSKKIKIHDSLLILFIIFSLFLFHSYQLFYHLYIYNFFNIFFKRYYFLILRWG